MDYFKTPIISTIDPTNMIKDLSESSKHAACMGCYFLELKKFELLDSAIDMLLSKPESEWFGTFLSAARSLEDSDAFGFSDCVNKMISHADNITQLNWACTVFADRLIIKSEQHEIDWTEAGAEIVLASFSLSESLNAPSTVLLSRFCEKLSFPDDPCGLYDAIRTMDAALSLAIQVEMDPNTILDMIDREIAAMDRFDEVNDGSVDVSDTEMLDIIRNYLQPARQEYARASIRPINIHRKTSKLIKLMFGAEWARSEYWMDSTEELLESALVALRDYLNYLTMDITPDANIRTGE